MPKIGVCNLSLDVKCDLFFQSMLKELFESFKDDKGEPDITIEIFGLPKDKLSLSPLDIGKKNILSKCIFPPFVGAGIIPLPFCPPLKNNDYLNLLKNVNDPFEVPLLNSLKAREKILTILDHSESVALTLHCSSVTIRDYKYRDGYIFYFKGFQDIIDKNSAMELFRRLIVSFFPLFSGILIHAGCLVYEDRAALFLAPDEGGKTTVMNSANRGTVVGDDRIYIKQQGEFLFAHGSPWGSIIDKSKSAKIETIFLLKKAKRFKLRKIESNKAIGFIWHEHRYDRFVLPTNLKTFTFDFIVKLCRQANVYQMDFPKDYVDWNAIFKAMEGRFEK
jgi:hypothetical protein